MEGQTSKYTLPNFAQDLHVVLVDFETTSLNKIKAKLEKFSFQVTGVSRASEALSMIGEDKTRYRFVIANYRTLPKMDYGSFVHELWQKQIPLIWMLRSYDEAEQALGDGASFLLLEPISSKKLKLLWQFAIRRRSNQEAGGASGSAARLDLLDNKNKQVVKKEQVNQRDKEEGLITTTNNQQEGSNHKRLIDDQQGNMQDKRTRYTVNFDKLESSSELQELNQNERGRRGDGNRNENGRERPVWNSERDRNFKAAYSELGIKATAKTIHEKMNDPDITPTQVGSRLQKFKSSLQKKNVDSGATSLPVTNNSSSSLARQPGNQNLPNLTPCADQNQDLNTIRAAPFSTRHQSQLPEGGVAATTELLGSAQARITSASATIPDKLPSNFSDGIKNPKPMGEAGPTAGLPNIPPYANQNQELPTNFAANFSSNCKNQLPSGVATTIETLGFEQASKHHANQNQDLYAIMAPFSTRHQSQLPEGGVAGTTELVGSVQGEITSGITTNSENFPMNFSDGMQNLQPIVEPAPAAGSSRHPAYGNQNQDLTTIRAAPFSTRHQSQFPEGGVAGTTELVGSVQGEITSGITTNSENFPMNLSDGMQNLQPIVEPAPAAGSSRHPAYGYQNQDLNTIGAAPFSTRHQSQLPEGGVAGTTELVGSVQGETTSGIVIEVENFLMNSSGGIQNEERIVEQAFSAGSSNLNQPQSQFAYNLKTNEDWEFIFRRSLNQGDNEQNQEPMAEHAPAADFLDNVEQAPAADLFDDEDRDFLHQIFDYQ